MINLIIWGLILVIILCVVLLVIKRTALGNKQNTYRVLMIIVILLAIIPLLIDFAKGSYPVAGYDEKVLNVQIDDIDSIENVGEILPDTTVEQSFYSDFSAIDSIDIYTQTYGRNNLGQLVVELIDKEKNEEIQRWEVDFRKIPNNDYLHLNMENPFQYEMHNKEYVIRITAKDSYQYNAVTTVMVDNQYDFGNLTINGEVVNKDLVFYINGYKGYYNMEKTRVWSCLFLMALLELPIYVLYRNKK